MVKLYGIAFCVLYVAAKLLVRCWVFRPAYERPDGLRHHSTLGSIDLLATLCLITAFFIFLYTATVQLATISTGVLLGYDVALRYVFLHREVQRTRARSARRTSYRATQRKVKRRALDDTST
jgi:hypothetical protein